MDEPEPQYHWDVTNLPYSTRIQDGRFWYNPSGKSWHWTPLTDEMLTGYGCFKRETVESRLARAFWRIGQLELELERRQDREREMRERE